MVSKRKKRQVPKVQTTSHGDKPSSPEALIRFNGELIEGLFASQAWVEIALPLLQESIASVSGRFTNGRFHQGDFTRTKQNRDELSGYQLALEQFHNRLADFIVEKDKLAQKRKEEEAEKVAPLYNPMMEEHEADDQD